MPLYEYRCPEGHVSELLRPRTVELVACPCGQAAARLEVYPIAVSGFTPVPPDERNHRQGFRDFVEARAEVRDVYDRADYNHDPIDKPDLAGVAIQRANAQVRAQGVSDAH